MTERTFSFIVPTRGRTESLVRLCDSIRAHTRRLDELEVVLVIDSDDLPSARFEYPGLHIRKVEGAPGRSMGALDAAGFCAASGRYLMLLNDDVVLETTAWDDTVLQVFQQFPDGMVLVHINETIFGRKLCTFPFLTRAFCELAGGICPDKYLRYRIDDHIHNIFDLLTLLGHRRRVFLPEVVFRHFNLTETPEGHDYVPNPEIHAVDTRLFDALLPERKRLALAAMEAIERHAHSQRRRVWESNLAPVCDSVAIRDPEHARVYPAPARPRVTVAVVSADMRSEHARRCLDSIKAHTSDFELVLVDNNRGAGFNHSREMNRLLDFCRTDYLALLDDDVFVEPGWLEGLLRAMEPGVGVATPVHRNRHGEFSYAGVVLQPDDSGHHTHVMAVGDRPQNIQTLCSAAMLVDMNRCGHVRLDERYSKYFLDIDYGLRIWEAGARVICSPWSQVTHVGGGTLEQGSHAAAPLFEAQRRHYVRSWIETRRLHALQRGIWKGIPEFDRLAWLKRDLDALFFQAPRLSREALLSRAATLVEELRAFPALKNYLAEQARAALAGQQPRVDHASSGHCALLLGVCGTPVLYETDVEGMNIVLWNTRFYALPASEGVFDYERMRAGGYSRSFEAGDLRSLRESMARHVLASGHHCDGAVAPPLSTRESHPVVELLPTPPAAVPTPPKGAGLPLRRLLQAAPYFQVLRPTHPKRGGRLFDVEYYRSSYPDVAAGRIPPLLHFILSGAFEGRRPHPLFDSAFYLRRNPDVARSSANPLGHYLKHGGREGRQPHPLFDPQYYLERYPDVRASGVNPLLHYILHGAAEGRQPHPLFQPEYYSRHCPEGARNGGNLLVHFLEQGGLSGYSPHPEFDCAYYLRNNPDVAAAGWNPLVHYLEYGAQEGRNPNSRFDSHGYLLAHPELRSRRMNPLVHYVLYAGMAFPPFGAA